MAANHQNGGSVYIAVLGASMVVVVLGLSAILLGRVQMQIAEQSHNTTEARLYAQSATEIGLYSMNRVPSWRTIYSNDTWNERNIGRGAMKWKLVDEVDGDLANNKDDPVRLIAWGMVGRATHKSSVFLATSVPYGLTESGPILLESYISELRTNHENVKANKWFAQFFKPNLPLGALGWRVTSVMLYAARGDTSTSTKVQLFKPDTHGMPSVNLYDEVVVSGDMLSTDRRWRVFSFSNHADLSPNEGLCLALTTTDAGNGIDFEYADLLMPDPDGAFIRGYPGWITYETSKSFRYKVYGICMMDTGRIGPVAIVGGSWRQEVSVGNSMQPRK